MARWVPEGLVVLGSLMGGMSLFLQERGARRLETKDCSAEELNKMGWDETALLLQK